MTDIRPATPADADGMAALRWEFRAGRGVPPTETREGFIARCTAWMVRELGSAGSWRAWVAVHDGRLAGQIWMHTIDKVPNPIDERERHGYISNLYVTPDLRGGVGSRLLTTTLDWAAANGIDRVVLWPSPQSKTLYLRHGFTRDGDVFELTCQ